MSKIALAALTIAAFAYALWLMLLKRRAPDPARASGLKKRFILATLLFVGLLGSAACGETDDPRTTCYAPLPDPPTTRPGTSRAELVGMLKAVWRTLDPKQSDAFRQKLESAAAQGAVRKKLADMLAVAYAEIAYHKQRTRGPGPNATCYLMTELGYTLSDSREAALKQLELLEKVRASGKIDEATASKAHTALSRELEMFYRASDVGASKGYRDGDRLARDYDDGKVFPGDVATVAAAMIVEMEDGPAPALTPATRLAAMKSRVKDLLKRGPAGNDWIDPDVNPNVLTVLAKAGLLEAAPMVLCYDRLAAPVAARSKELETLQRDILDRSVETGILDVETAEKAGIATAREAAPDYATEKDIKTYQKKVRRAVRILYKRGELPSAFVEEVERAVDVDIVAFNPSKALRNDVGYHLRSVLWQPIRDSHLKGLEKRGLIPPAKNHRGVLDWYGRAQDLSEPQKKQVAQFFSLLDGKTGFALPGDEKAIPRWQLPRTDADYRLRVRTVCRALVKTGLVSDTERLAPIGHAIGIPVTGALENR